MQWQSIRLLVPMLLVGVASAVATAQEGGARLSEATDHSTTPLFNADDVLFLQHMIVHHEQAIVMSALVPTRSDRGELIRFARYVSRAQAAEIESMQSLLELAADRGVDVPDYHAHGDPPMAGMLSNAQMAAIEAASRAEFERLWLEGMIYHHQGAIDMALAQQRQQLDTGRQPYEIAVLVEEILVEQRVEIGKMREWLDEWGLAGPVRQSDVAQRAE